MGRKPKLNAHQIKEARQRLAKGEKPATSPRFSRSASARFRGSQHDEIKLQGFWLGEANG